MDNLFHDCTKMILFDGSDKKDAKKEIVHHKNSGLLIYAVKDLISEVSCLEKV